MYNDWERDAKAVRELGSELGWGHLMEMAAALWVIDHREKGYPDSGCFVPTCVSFIANDETRKAAIQQREMYIRGISGGSGDG